MKRNLEEKLAMLAFGDMSPEETSRLESELAGDREALAILAQYRGMRTGLRALGDVPDHQLSSERLRHAVLNRGLKPKSRPQLGWLWMPAAAAAMSFAIFLVVHRSDSQLRDLPSIASNQGSIDSGSDFALATASAEILSVAQPAVPKMTLAMDRPSSRHGSRHLIEVLKARVSQDFLNLMSADNNPGAHVAQTFAPTGNVQAASSNGQPIVMIGSSKDANTGAQKATEVDSAGNVVVGG